MRELTKEQLVEIVRTKKPTSLSAISQALGYKGAISGSLGKHIRELIPGIDEVLMANRTAQKTKAQVGGKTSETEGGKKVQAKTQEPKGKSSSPFRISSSYHAIYTILASHKDGIRRDALVKLAAQKTGKDEKHASYDVSVVLSAKDSNTGPRHKSCKEGFWIRREADHVTLVID